MPNLTVHVKPGSSKGPLVEQLGEREYTVYLRERAVDGKANQALVKVLSRHLGVRKSRVAIARGHTARTKIIAVEE